MAAFGENSDGEKPCWKNIVENANIINKVTDSFVASHYVSSESNTDYL
jgi:hypothetical protein